MFPGSDAEKTKMSLPLIRDKLLVTIAMLTALD